MANPKKSKAFIITFIAVILLLIIGYWLFSNRDKLFGVGEISIGKIFEPLLGTSERVGLDIITEGKSGTNITTNRVVIPVKAGENLPKNSLIYAVGANPNGNLITMNYDESRDGSRGTVPFGVAIESIDSQKIGKAVVINKILAEGGENITANSLVYTNYTTKVNSDGNPIVFNYDETRDGPKGIVPFGYAIENINTGELGNIIIVNNKITAEAGEGVLSNELVYVGSVNNNGNPIIFNYDEEIDGSRGIVPFATTIGNINTGNLGEIIVINTEEDTSLWNKTTGFLGGIIGSIFGGNNQGGTPTTGGPNTGTGGNNTGEFGDTNNSGNTYDPATFECKINGEIVDCAEISGLICTKDGGTIDCDTIINPIDPNSNFECKINGEIVDCAEISGLICTKYGNVINCEDLPLDLGGDYEGGDYGYGGGIDNESLPSPDEGGRSGSAFCSSNQITKILYMGNPNNDEDEVRSLQLILSKLNSKSLGTTYLKASDVDGSFGPGTRLAVATFQKDNNLTQKDGTVDGPTMSMLNTKCEDIEEGVGNGLNQCDNDADNYPKCTTKDGKCLNGSTNTETCALDKVEENKCANFEQYPLEFTPEEKAELADLLRKFYLIAPTLKTEEDLNLVYNEIDRYKELIKQVNELTKQCYLESASKEEWLYRGETYSFCSRNPDLCSKKGVTKQSNCGIDNKGCEELDIFNDSYTGPTTRFGNPWYLSNWTVTGGNKTSENKIESYVDATRYQTPKIVDYLAEVNVVMKGRYDEDNCEDGRLMYFCDLTSNTIHTPLITKYGAAQMDREKFRNWGFFPSFDMNKVMLERLREFELLLYIW